MAKRILAIVSVIAILLTIAPMNIAKAANVLTLTAGSSGTATVTAGSADRTTVFITAPVSGTYTFVSSNNGNCDPTAYDSNGNIISDDVAGIGNNFRFSVTLSASQSYWFYAGTYPNTAANYGVAVAVGSSNSTTTTTTTPTPTPAPPPATSSDDHSNSYGSATTMSLNTTYFGTINPSTDIDWFKFTVPATGTFSITSTVSDSLDSYGELYNSSQTRIAYNDDYTGNAFGFPSVNLSPGTYYIKVTSYNSNFTGIYSLRVTGSATSTTPTPTPPPAASGYALTTASPSRSISFASNTRVQVSVTATTTGTYTFTSSNNGSYDPAAYSAISGGTKLADDESGKNFILSVPLTAGQTYSFYAAEYYGNACSYTVSVAFPAATSSYSITVSCVAGTAAANRAEFYTSGAATVQSTNLTSGSDPALYNSAGERIADDEAGSSHFSYTTVSGTRYYAGTFGNAPGSYMITSTAPVTLVRNGSAATTYTITYNANGGSGAPAAQTKTSGVALTLSSTVPTRTGYRFLGWSTSSSATSATYAAGASYTANAASTLYAVWQAAPTVTLTFNGNGGTPGTQTKTAAAGASIMTAAPTAPTKSDAASFGGWFTSATGGTQLLSNSVVPSVDTTYYARWNVTISLYDRGTLTERLSKLSGSAVGSLTNLGGTFAGWYSDQSAGTLISSTTIVPTKDTSYYACRNSTVTWNANGGSVTLGSSTGQVGTALTFPTPSRNNYVFDGWYNSPSGGNKITSTVYPTSSQTYYAQWVSSSSGPSDSSSWLAYLIAVDNLFASIITTDDLLIASSHFVTNLSHGSVKTIINGQGNSPYAEFTYGGASFNTSPQVHLNGVIADNGCAVIAAHNALILLGFNSEFRDVIYYHELLSPIAQGALGTNPLDSRRLFQWKGVTVTTSYTESNFDLMLKNNDVVILTYNNGPGATGFLNGVHTVAITQNPSGGILVYNYQYYSTSAYSNFSSIANLLNANGDSIVMLGLKRN